MKRFVSNIENGQVVSVEIDGIEYTDPDQIPDPDDRARASLLMSQPTAEDSDFDEEFDKDFRELERQSARFPGMIFMIFLATSILMLVIATISAVRAARSIAREESAPGQVVDLTVRRDEEGQDTYYPVVEFSLPDGGPQRVQLSEGSWPPGYTKGELVTVLYDPAKPLEARIKSGSSTLLKWLVSGITGFLGLAFLAAALFARSLQRT